LWEPESGSVLKSESGFIALGFQEIVQTAADDGDEYLAMAFSSMFLQNVGLVVEEKEDKDDRKNKMLSGNSSSSNSPSYLLGDRLLDPLRCVLCCCCCCFVINEKVTGKDVNDIETKAFLRLKFRFVSILKRNNLFYIC
jgi:hypothetical protein